MLWDVYNRVTSFKTPKSTVKGRLDCRRLVVGISGFSEFQRANMIVLRANIHDWEILEKI